MGFVVVVGINLIIKKLTKKKKTKKKTKNFLL